MASVRERLEREEAWRYRATLWTCTLLVPLFGVTYHHVAPHELDPLWIRVILGLVCLAMVSATYLSSWAKRHVGHATFLLAQVIVWWVVWLAWVNGFSAVRVLGIVMVHFCASFVFLRLHANAAIHAAVLIGTVLGYAASDQPSVSVLFLVLTELTVSLFSVASIVRWEGAIAMLVHREAELDQARETLEDRVQQRTRALAHEVTERREAEARASHASVAKSQFLASMSHELRTPLNAVIGYTELVREEVQDVAVGLGVDRHLERVQRSATHLLHMINDILDLAKVESGQWDIAWEPVDATQVLTTVAETVTPIATSKNNRVTVDVDRDVPLVWSDSTRLTQILVNLASNAAKFTTDGTVRLHASTTDSDVTIEVIDTGCGIPEDKLETVFEKFVQLDGPSTRRHPGTGLGLALCRELAQVLRARIDVHSEVGVGSTFVLTLPSALHGQRFA
ncbi:MAG: hypothetical protein KTR31_03640 [Myxococcales bacterium]|nr:hypothetical protein [Myxococcales bacterium]